MILHFILPIHVVYIILHYILQNIRKEHFVIKKKLPPTSHVNHFSRKGERKCATPPLSFLLLRTQIAFPLQTKLEIPLPLSSPSHLLLLKPSFPSWHLPFPSLQIIVVIYFSSFFLFNLKKKYYKIETLWQG